MYSIYREGLPLDRGLQTGLKETRRHGDAMFPLGVYEIALPGGAHVLDTHWHEEAEFFMLLEGDILFQTGTEVFPLRAGEAAFIDPGDIHAAYPADDRPCRFCAIVFHPDLIASAQYDAVQQSAVLPLREKRRTFPRVLRPAVPWQRELLDTLGRIAALYGEQPSGFRIRLKAALLELLALLAPDGRADNRSETGEADSAKLNRLKTVLLHIQERYAEPLRVAELAGLVHMSEGQFSRFFKAMTRKTPVEYINDYRVARAAEALRGGERKISDIALDAGFDNVSYFIKVFRRAMGCSPSEFRRQAEESTAPPPDGSGS